MNIKDQHRIRTNQQIRMQNEKDKISQATPSYYKRM